MLAKYFICSIIIQHLIADSRLSNFKHEIVWIEKAKINKKPAYHVSSISLQKQKEWSAMNRNSTYKKGKSKRKIKIKWKLSV